MPLPEHWRDLSLVALIDEVAPLYYGQIPNRENLFEPPDGADFWTIENALDYMWTADVALRMLTDLPRSGFALMDLLDTARVQYTKREGEIRLAKTWHFPDGTTLEMEEPFRPGPVAYNTGYYPENIVVTHERF